MTIYNTFRKLINNIVGTIDLTVPSSIFQSWNFGLLKSDLLGKPLRTDSSGLFTTGPISLSTEVSGTLPNDTYLADNSIHEVKLAIDNEPSIGQYLQTTGSSLVWAMPSGILTTDAVGNKLTAGQSFSANTTYAVRWAVDGETAGNIYAADKLAPTTAEKYWSIGVIQTGASGYVVGDYVSVVQSGLITLRLNDTGSWSSGKGKPVFLMGQTTPAIGSFGTSDPELSVASGNYFASVIIGTVAKTSAIITDVQVLISCSPAGFMGIGIAQ